MPKTDEEVKEIENEKRIKEEEKVREKKIFEEKKKNLADKLKNEVFDILQTKKNEGKPNLSKEEIALPALGGKFGTYQSNKSANQSFNEFEKALQTLIDEGKVKKNGDFYSVT
jgi:hypothetical protein